MKKTMTFVWNLFSYLANCIYLHLLLDFMWNKRLFFADGFSLSVCLHLTIEASD